MHTDSYKLWVEFYPKVFGYYFRRVNNRQDCEDLTSLVLTSFVQKMIDPDTSIQNPHGYLWRSAHNHLVNYIKSKSVGPTMVGIEGEIEDVIDEGYEMLRSIHYRDKIQNLMECAKNQLKEIELKIIEEVVICDKKAPAVAVEIGLTPENVRQRLSRGLKKLRIQCLDLWQNFNN
jgi:RNA polymerase sigma factor (sigma-70 family)